MICFVIFKIILLLQYKNGMAPVLEQNGPTLGMSLSNLALLLPL